MEQKKVDFVVVNDEKDGNLELGIIREFIQVIL